MLTWYLVCSLMITAIPMTDQIYDFKVIKIIKKSSLPNSSKLKQITIVWIASLIVQTIITIVQYKKVFFFEQIKSFTVYFSIES